ncbi:MAG: T9SS type A sorting domain-containing protein [Bacteroidetes bacterium]|nr:T9SS type A sorting domain-containing protein [Bacteroidota bacterium]
MDRSLSFVGMSIRACGIGFLGMLWGMPSCVAQFWGLSEASWSYEWFSTLDPSGYVTVDRTGDTVITGLPAQMFEATTHLYDVGSGEVQEAQLGRYFTTINDDLVSIWNGETFDTLYWYGAVPGDHWRVPLTMQSPVEITVTDTGTAVMQGVALRYLTVAYEPSFGVSGDTLFERIGSRRVFVEGGLSLGMDAPIIGLRCYSDVEITYDTGLAASCFAMVGQREFQGVAVPALYPNPGSDHVTIVPGYGIARVVVYDVAGRTCLQQDLPNAPVILNTSGLPSGCYSISIITGQKEGSSARWVKQ